MPLHHCESPNYGEKDFLARNSGPMGFPALGFIIKIKIHAFNTVFYLFRTSFFLPYRDINRKTMRRLSSLHQ